MKTEGYMDSRIKYNNYQPCDHSGCLHHRSHPCEGCGRTEGKGIVYENEVVAQITKRVKSSNQFPTS